MSALDTASGMTTLRSLLGDNRTRPSNPVQVAIGTVEDRLREADDETARAVILAEVVHGLFDECTFEELCELSRILDEGAAADLDCEGEA